MSEVERDAGVAVERVSRPPAEGLKSLLLAALPLALLFIAGYWLLTSDPIRVLGGGAPPVETVTFERRILDGEGLHLKFRAGGSQALTIAQVQVDGAYWQFTQEPAGPLPRLASTWVHIPYPWVLGEAHTVKLISSTGASFEHVIQVAVATPQAQFGELRPLGLVGAFVGILPVALGLMFFPVMRRLGQGGIDFVLALTCGLLAFLLVDMLKESIELAGAAAPAFQGPVGVILIAGLACLALLAVGRRSGTPEGLTLAWFMALGIGMHNFGEGLSIGAALATGAAGLGAFLVLGFTLHNITEGIGIAAPLLKQRPSLFGFVGLTALAGAPAIPGIWLGSFAVAPHWAALALAIGAGAILQVLIEVGAYMARRRGDVATLTSAPVLSGLALGVAMMFVTAMIIRV